MKLGQRYTANSNLNVRCDTFAARTVFDSG